MIDRHSIRFGASSWTYEGWQGLVYKRPYPPSRFTKDALAEYAIYEYAGAPLFRTVGIDHTFYRPATVKQLAHYASLVPTDFHFCSKVWEELTIPAYANLPRYGLKAGTRNPRFLDASAFQELVLSPAVEGLGRRAGPFIFEFQRSGLDTDSLLASLDIFLSNLPAGPSYAVEVRNPTILGDRYRETLSAHGVAHVYNHWTAMPPLLDQHRLMGNRFTAGFVLLRLLTPLGLAYAKAVERYRPYDRIAEVLPRMRKETVTLIAQAVSEGKTPYVLVNNRAEGCSPLTIQALVDALEGKGSVG